MCLGPSGGVNEKGHHLRGKHLLNSQWELAQYVRCCKMKGRMALI